MTLTDCERLETRGQRLESTPHCPRPDAEASTSMCPSRPSERCCGKLCSPDGRIGSGLNAKARQHSAILRIDARPDRSPYFPIWECGSAKH
jgi:hypothetical protein